MAHLVKTKISIFSVSVIIIAVIPMLRTNFFQQATIKKWSSSALAWEDFKGIPRPFTGYGAAISSQIYLEYDSLQRKHVAYAGQNNMRSWVRKSTMNYPDALVHEQYHFNITEYHARKFNRFIEENPRADSGKIMQELEFTKAELMAMQLLYDEETDHSLIIDQQAYWEFKIDSLLNSFHPEEHLYTDLLSGMQMYFPVKPIFKTGTAEHNAYRLYSLHKYGVRFNAVAYQYLNDDFADIKDRIDELYNYDSLQVLKAKEINNEEDWRYYVEYYDSVSHKSSDDIWIVNSEKFLFRVKITSSLGEGYDQIKKSFYGNISLIDTKPYILNKRKKMKEFSVYSSRDNIAGTGVSKPYGLFCYTFMEPQQKLFFKPPFKNEYGDLVIAYDCITDSTERVHLNLVNYNGKTITSEPDSSFQVFIVPDYIFKEPGFSLTFGYLPEKDSLDKCYNYFYQTYYP